MSKPKVIAVVGPTASGKTGLAISLAKQFAGEVISADSRQVYKGLDIGTAKVTVEEAQGVPHHLIDITTLDAVYTGTDFIRDADAAIADITARGKLPIVAGGTFFYIELLRRAMHPAPVPPNYMLRNQLDQLSTAELFTKLQYADPRRAASIDAENRRRLIRALEIIDTLGAVPQKSTASENPYDMLLFGITREKSELRERFAQRAKDWLVDGLITEVEQLLHNGVSRTRLQEIGFEYTLALTYLEGECTKDTFIEAFVQKNWQYAKRQMAWLTRDKTITWIDPKDYGTAEMIVKEFLHQ